MLLFGKALDEAANGNWQALVNFFKEHPRQPTNWDKLLAELEENPATSVSPNNSLLETI